MQITKRSLLTGREHTLDLAVTAEGLARWRAGTLIQEVFPHLAPSEREFLISGTTPEEWAETFGAECTVPNCDCPYDHGRSEAEQEVREEYARFWPIKD